MRKKRQDGRVIDRNCKLLMAVILSAILLGQNSLAAQAPGWYLVIPPFAKYDSKGELYTSPFPSHWMAYPFDTFNECQDGLEEFLRRQRDFRHEAQEVLKQVLSHRESPDFKDRLTGAETKLNIAEENFRKTYFSRCVAKDDPRLK